MTRREELSDTHLLIAVRPIVTPYQVSRSASSVTLLKTADFISPEATQQKRGVSNTKKAKNDLPATQIDRRQVVFSIIAKMESDKIYPDRRKNCGGVFVLIPYRKDTAVILQTMLRSQFSPF